MKTGLFLMLICWTATANTQSRVISGKIKDAVTKNNIRFGSLQLVNFNSGVVSDENGNFKLEIPGSILQQKIIISAAGYITDTAWLSPEKNEYLFYLAAYEQPLDAVVITGVSKATLIRENPISISRVSSKAIEQTNESNIIDVLVKNVPGLNAVKTGPNISKPFIRGLGYNRVLTLYDGVRQEGQQWGDEHGIETDAYNIEKAEVIKGPASLLYGSDALAGVVSLFPYVPRSDDKKVHGKFTSGYETNNNLIGNGLRFHYNNEHFLWALAGSFRIAKNYRNAIDGRVYNTGFEEKNLSALLGFKSHKNYAHFNFTFYENLQGIPDGSRDSASRKFTRQANEGDEDDILTRPVVSNNRLKSYQLSPLHQHIQHLRLYNHTFFEIGKGDIDILMALQQNIRREFSHPTLPKQPGLNIHLNTLNYGIRYNAPRFANVESTLGINGMLQNNKNKDATDFPIPDYHLEEGGIFLFAKWKQKKWTVSGGIRYDIRRIKWNDFYITTNAITGFDQRLPSLDTAGATLQFAAFENTFANLSASAGVTYRLSTQISLKANIAKGYRAPNITEMASNGLDPGAHIIYLGNKNFQSEFSLQEDLGLIGNFKNISAEISVFNNHIQNYIYLSMLADENGNSIIDAQGNKTFQYQQASAQLYGMEAWLSFQPEKIKGFRLDNSFSVVYGFNRKSIYKNKGINGEYLSLIPPANLLSSISQKIETTSKKIPVLSAKIELESHAAQNNYLGLNNTETATPAYTLINAGMSAEVLASKTKTIQFQIQLNNLFDKAYHSHLSRLKYFEYFTRSADQSSGMYNMGRNICLKIIASF